MQLLRALSSHRLTAFLMVVLIGFFTLASVPVEKLPADIYYWLFKLDLLQVWQSTWFVVLLLIFFLNLFLRLLQQLRSNESHLTPVNPLPVDQLKALETAGTGAQEFLFSHFRCSMDEDDFEEMVKRAAPGPVLRVEETQTQEVQYFVRNRPTLRWSSLMIHLALLVLGVGLIYSWQNRFRGEFTLEPGEKMTHVQAVQGIPQGWEAFRSQSDSLGNYFVPPFSMTLEKVLPDFYPGTAKLRNIYSWVSLSDKNGNYLRTERIAVGEKLRFEGYHFFQQSFSLSGQAGMDLLVLSEDGQTYRTYPGLQVGQILPLDLPQQGKALVRVLKLEPSLERMGDSMQVQVNRPGGEAQTLWIFERYPEARPPFKVSAFRPIYRSHLIVASDPALGILIAGAGLMLLALVLGALSSQGEFWFVWREDAIWIASPVRQRPWIGNDFERLAHNFKRELIRMDRSARNIKYEVERGFF